MLKSAQPIPLVAIEGPWIRVNAAASAPARPFCRFGRLIALEQPCQCAEWNTAIAEFRTALPGIPALRLIVRPVEIYGSRIGALGGISE
jgi:hypothetical protein